jgi:hypothetical protein
MAHFRSSITPTSDGISEYITGHGVFPKDASQLGYALDISRHFDQQWFNFENIIVEQPAGMHDAIYHISSSVPYSSSMPNTQPTMSVRSDSVSSTDSEYIPASLISSTFKIHDAESENHSGFPRTVNNIAPAITTASARVTVSTNIAAPTNATASTSALAGSPSRHQVYRTIKPMDKPAAVRKANNAPAARRNRSCYSRQSHSLVEQRYRNSLNAEIRRLEMSVPHLAAKSADEQRSRPTKATIIACAV